MQLNIPLTVFQDEPSGAAYTIKRCHVPRMYEDGLRQVGDVCTGNIRMSTTQNSDRIVSQLRWAGSERFLYNMVAKLGERIHKTDHEAFRADYDLGKLQGTERAPGWISVPAVFDRHKNELAYIDNLDRLYSRWCSSTVSNVVSIRSNGTPDDPDCFKLICRNLDTGFDLTKLHLNMCVLNDILNTYHIYATDNRTFFYRNRYRRITSCSLGDMDRSYTQCTLPATSLTRFLNNRGNRE